MHRRALLVRRLGYAIFSRKWKKNLNRESSPVRCRRLLKLVESIASPKKTGRKFFEEKRLILRKIYFSTQKVILAYFWLKNHNFQKVPKQGFLTFFASETFQYRLTSSLSLLCSVSPRAFRPNLVAKFTKFS